MFYIRNNSSKKVLNNNLELSKGLDITKECEQDVSLMYSLPSKRGIKVFLNKVNIPYKLSIEGYPTKKTKTVIEESKDLLKLYVKIKDLELDENFSGKILIRAEKSEIAQLNKNDIDSVVRDISIPLDKIYNVVSQKDLNKEEDTDDVKILDLPDMIKTSTNQSKGNIAESESVKVDSKAKYTEYEISGVLRNGSLVILTNRIKNYKEALEAYNKIKESESSNFNEIRLDGYRDDGSKGTRFRKTFAPEILSYEYISEFVKDLGERLALLELLTRDAKSAMAIEDKRYNAGYHIMEVADFDLNNEDFKENIMQMKIAADKRRDMKKVVSLLTSINDILPSASDVKEKISTQLKKVDTQTTEGTNLYRNTRMNDFIKEYKVAEDLLNVRNSLNDKLTVRTINVENKLVVYEKHYK